MPIQVHFDWGVPLKLPSEVLCWVHRVWCVNLRWPVGCILFALSLWRFPIGCIPFVVSRWWCPVGCIPFDMFRWRCPVRCISFGIFRWGYLVGCILLTKGFRWRCTVEWISVALAQCLCPLSIFRLRLLDGDTPLSIFLFFLCRWSGSDVFIPFVLLRRRCLSLCFMFLLSYLTLAVWNCQIWGATFFVPRLPYLLLRFILIMDAETAQRAKHFGTKVGNEYWREKNGADEWKEDVWIKVRRQVMIDGLLLKFDQNRRLLRCES